MIADGPTATGVVRGTRRAQCTLQPLHPRQRLLWQSPRTGIPLRLDLHRRQRVSTVPPHVPSPPVSHTVSHSTLAPPRPGKWCHVSSPPRSAQKGGFFGPAAKEGIALLLPDTSPRGAGVPGETDDWQFGVGVSYFPQPSLCPPFRGRRGFVHVCACH